MPDSLITKPPSAYSYPLLIKNILTFPVVNNPAQEIVYRDTRLTYHDLHERVARLAAALTALGVKRGDTVAVMDWDSNRYLECFFAVPMIGAVLHTINVRLSPEQILYTIDHAEDDVLLVHADFLPIIEQIRGRIDTVKQYVLLRDDCQTPLCTVSFAGEYEALLAAAEPLTSYPDFDENTRATTFYTTGTTGLPKGVYFSHRQLVLHTMSVMAVLSTAGHGSLRRDDVYMPITPMFHVHAWGVPYIATMLGVKQVYPGRYVPETLLELVAREKVTFSHCVPTILHMLLKHPLAQDIDLRGWKLIIGGAALTRGLCLEALERGIDVFTGYGMSETCPILTISHLTKELLATTDCVDQAQVRCKTGLAIPLVDLKIVDAEMCEQPWDGNSTGEIVVRSPWLTQGYLKDAKASERLWEGGYLHTGDVAVRDDLGYVRITDRMKDVIKVAGEWVSSLELEDIIIQHPAVAEVAVIGMQDPKWGERPLALVVPKADHQLSEKDLVHHVRTYADRGLITKQVVLLKARIVEVIAKTSVGKINKVALRELFLT